MSRNTAKLTAILTLATMLTVGSSVWSANSAASDHAAATASTAKSVPPQENLENIHTQRLPALQSAIQHIIADLQAGRSQEALTQLKQMQASLESLQKAIGTLVKPTFVNGRCPIIGNTIDPANVPASLIREYHGQKVAFCCEGCPAAWDKLSDAEKAAKLKVAVGPQRNSDSHAHPADTMNMQM